MDTDAARCARGPRAISTDPDQQAEALTRLAEAATAAGDHERAARLAGHAEVLTTQITDPYQQAQALTRLAEAVTAAGDHERAEVLTTQITNPDQQAEVLTRLATLLVATSNEITPASEHAGNSPPLMVRARHLVATALVTGSWTEIIVSLATVDPLAVAAVVDEVLVRWGLDSADGARGDRVR